MMIGKILRIGYINREKVLATNPVASVNVSNNGDTQTALLELSEQADETSNLDKTGVLANT